MSDNTGKTILALLAGAAIGAGIGILFAPDKGSETRRKIREGVDHEKDLLKQRLSEVTDNIKSRFSKAKRDLESEVDHLLENSDHKREEIIEALEKKLAELKNKA
jgi:gas vesicle protein